MGVEQLELVAVVGVLLIVAASYLAPKFGVATPIALVVLGLGLSFLPGLPPLAPHPELILAGVLPPLLYSAAVNMPAVDFRRDLRTIGAPCPWCWCWSPPSAPVRCCGGSSRS